MASTNNEVAESLPTEADITRARETTTHVVSYIEQTSPLNFGARPVAHISEIIASALASSRLAGEQAGMKRAAEKVQSMADLKIGLELPSALIKWLRDSN